MAENIESTLQFPVFGTRGSDRFQFQSTNLKATRISSRGALATT
jgi:hypothetical protein